MFKSNEQYDECTRNGLRSNVQLRVWMCQTLSRRSTVFKLDPVLGQQVTKKIQEFEAKPFSAAALKLWQEG